MEIEILKKKIDSYRTSKGRLTKIPDELAYEMLLAWEQWTGKTSGFYSALGADYRKVAGILGRAKKLKRAGHFAEGPFKEIQLASNSQPSLGVQGTGSLITVRWQKDRVIRFSQVSQLVEFLEIMERKTAA
jgi:hypothetical protein